MLTKEQVAKLRQYAPAKVTVLPAKDRPVHRIQSVPYQQLGVLLTKLSTERRLDVAARLQAETGRAKLLGRSYNQSALDWVAKRLKEG